MNTAKHAQFTPGPWEHKGNRVYRKDSYEVAWIAGQGPHSEWQANATLIAAAPAMYEALRQLVHVEQLRKQAVTENDYVDLVLADSKLQQLAQAVLAQAKGE